MTLRLVALMSVVLLLSLAAFGLMMSHYQDRVMEEVARTASEVGRATLRTLESHGQSGTTVTAPARAASGAFVWESNTVSDGDGVEVQQHLFPSIVGLAVLIGARPSLKALWGSQPPCIVSPFSTQ